MHNYSPAHLRGIIMSCAAMALAGCASSPASRSPPPASPSEIFASLQRSFPDGVAPDIAQQRMEENGFACTHISNGTFVHHIRHEGGRQENRSLENIDFLRCRRKTQQGWVTYFDDVALVVKDDVVVDALINWSAVGP